MLLKKLDEYPGGRGLIFVPVVALACVGSLILTANELTQVDNCVLLALTAALVYLYRHSIRIFLQDENDAGNVWMSLGIFTLVLATVALTAFSLYLRATGTLLDTTNSRFVSLVRFTYAFSFGCLYVAKFADEEIVPPKGWISLVAIVMGASAVSLLGMWFF